jgi:Fe-S cluster assembly protein SufD
MIALKEDLINSHILFQEKHTGNDYINIIRREAIAQFEKLGFPTTKDEEWKYTSLSTILKNEYKLFPKDNHSLEYKDIKSFLLDEIESYKLVFIDGKFSNHLSKTTHDEGDICILSSSFNKTIYQSLLENYFNKIAPKNNSFIALNTAYTNEGSFIHIPKNTIVSKPIQIVYFSTKEHNTFYNPRNLLVIEENSQVQIIESHYNLTHSQNINNVVTEISVAKNSTLDYFKLQNDNLTTSIIDNTHIYQQEKSTTNVFTFSFGGKITRNNLHFYHQGEYIESNLKGITLIDENQLVDHHTLVDHKFPNCNSNEQYKGLFLGYSKGVFNGKIFVHSEAQKTNAFQSNNNIILSENASVDTKPQLEIFADDVKCSHGCTVGELDDDALFYLQTRGIPKDEAKALLTYAFSSDILNSINIKALKDRISQLIAKKLNVDTDFGL